MERNAVRRLGPSITTARKLNVGGGPSNYQPSWRRSRHRASRGPEAKERPNPIWPSRSLAWVEVSQFNRVKTIPAAMATTSANPARIRVAATKTRIACG